MEVQPTLRQIAVMKKCKKKLVVVAVDVDVSKNSNSWKNCYQESFYSNFKLDLRNVNRFKFDFELTEAIYHQIYYYNHHRIHGELKMSPTKFYKLSQCRSDV